MRVLKSEAAAKAYWEELIRQRRAGIKALGYLLMIFITAIIGFVRMTLSFGKKLLRR